jgi:hypothetical protein
METKIIEEALQSKISNIEQLKFVTKGGQILRWVVVTMANGFAVTGKPSCAVDPTNDDEELGQKIALQNAINEAWILEGYALKEKLANPTYNINPVPAPTMNMSFGDAITAMKQGSDVARLGWNGKGIFISLQTPTDQSYMTTPYIYIDSTQLQTDNPDAVLNRVPWFPSQTDLLSMDWFIV